MTSSWDGAVAVVTGAASGIGRAMAERFGAEGMALALCDVDAAGLDETVARVRSVAPDVDLVAAAVDVRIGEQVEAFADDVFARFGQVDLLCNNAGVFVGGLLWERTPEDFEFSLGVNLYGIVHAARAFVPGMNDRGVEAHIVNTVSVAGLLGTPFAGPYSASKFAAFAATESLAGDLVASGSPVRAHALCPGAIDTRIASSERVRPASLASPRTEDQDFVESMLADTVRDGMDPAEVAGIVLDALAEPDRFLILTHPEFSEQIVTRGDVLSRGDLPAPASFG